MIFTAENSNVINNILCLAFFVKKIIYKN